MKKIVLGILVVLAIGCSSDSPAENEIPANITDVDGNNYTKITIGQQIWLKENLNVSRYRDGTVIPEVNDPEVWATLTTGAWRYYNDDSENGKVYGKLYNWYAVKDPRGLAPDGCHIPSDEEWEKLSNFLGPGAGGEMKEASTDYWFDPNEAATNNSGFTGLPGGLVIKNGSFYFDGSFGYWWTSTGQDATTAWNRSLGYNSGIICRSYDNKNYGFSVRCIIK